MAAYDAGSIDARLDVDTRPFDEGLRLAQIKADEFERKKIAPRVDTNDSSVRGLGDDLDNLSRSADNASHSFLGGGLAGKGLIAGIATLIPLIDPLAGQILGLTSAFTVAGVGVGLFAAVGVSDFKKMTAATDAVTKAQTALSAATTDKARIKALHDLAAANALLVGPMGQAARALERLKTSWATLGTATAKPVFGDFTKAFNIIDGIIPKLAPIITTTATAIGHSLNQIGTAVDSPGFQKFLDFIQSNIGGVLKGLTGGLMGFASGFASLVENSVPLLGPMVKQVTDLGAGFNTLAKSPAFRQFVSFLATQMPGIEKLFGGLFGLIGHIMVALEPAVGPALNFLNMLVAGLTKIASGGALSSVARLFGVLLNALAPLLPLLATLLNKLIPPLAQALVQWVRALAPLIPVIGQALVAMVPALIPLLTLIGQLAPLFGDLLNMLMPLMPILIKLIPLFLMLNSPILAVAFAAEEIIKHWKGIAGFFHRIWTDVARYFINAWNSIIGGLHSAWNHVSAFFGNIPGAIVGFFGNAGHWLLHAGGQILGGLSQGVQTIWSNVTRFFRAVPGAIRGVFSGAINWLWNIGKDLIQGLWNGITSIWNKMTGWLSNAASKIGGFLKHPWSIFSPSRMTHEIGQNFVLGLHNGMKESWADMETWLSGAANDIDKHLNMTASVSTTKAQSAAITELNNNINKLASAHAAAAQATAESGAAPVNLYLDPNGQRLLAKVVSSTNARREARL